MNADQELAMMLDALATGEATAAQRARWARLAADRPAAAQELREQVAMALRLRSILAPPDDRLADRVLGLVASDDIAARRGTAATIDRRLGSRVRLRPVPRSMPIPAPVWLSLAAGLLLSTVFLVWRHAAIAPSSTPAYAEVERVDECTVLAIDGRGMASQRQDLTAGARLALSAGQASVRFPDGTILGLSAGVALMIGPDAPGRSVHLAVGSFDAMATRQPEDRPLRIFTPQAALTVLGTAFSLSADTERTLLVMHGGRISLATIDGRSPLVVIAGQSAEVRTGGMPRLITGTGGGRRHVVSLLPLADGYVRAWEPQARCGRQSLLAIKPDGLGPRNHTREIFLRFPAEWRGRIERAILHLESITPGTPTRQVLHGTVGDWDEVGLCWANRPADLGPVLATWTVTGKGHIAIDVTTAVRDHRTGPIDWNIRGLDPVGPDGMCAYASREYIRSSAWPRLEVTFLEPE